MQKITPFLWFNNNAEEAIHFYTSVFKESKVVSVNHLPGEAPGLKGPVITGTIELAGQQFMVLNGGPMFTFTEAVSLFVNCETQEEVDYLWNKLTDGGQESRCGWLKDKFGLSWQIIPLALGKLMGDQNRKKAQNVMKAMMQMKKIIVADLQKAYDEG